MRIELLFFSLLLTAFATLTLDSDGYTWNEFDTMPSPRADLSAVILDWKIYLIGGSPHAGQGDNNTIVVGTVQIYDPYTKSWSDGPSLNTPRYRHCACQSDGVIYVIGGRDSDDNAIESVEFLRPGAVKWEQAEPLLIPRSDLGCFALNGVIYAAGGYDASYSVVLSSVEQWDASNPVHTMAPSLTYARGDTTCVTVLTGREAYCAGGFGSDWSLIQTGSVEVYNGSAWRTFADLEHPRADLAFAYLDNSLFVTAGEDWINNEDVAVSDSEIYSFVSGAWHEHEPMPEGARFRVATATLSAKEGDAVFVFGGHDSNKNPVDHVEVFTTATVFASLNVVASDSSSSALVPLLSLFFLF